MLSRRALLKSLVTGLVLTGLSEESFARSEIPIIKRIRYSSTEERTRIVLDCTGKIKRKYISEVLKGKVLWITVSRARANRLVRRLKSPLVEEVKVIPITRSKVKVKVELKSPHKYKIFALRSCGRKPFRIVIDVLPEFLNVECEVRKSRERVVVLDPGHGGKDPGAVWPIGSRHPRIREKDITLSIARKVKRHLLRYPDIKVVMTRERDVYVPLLKRAEIAARSCADAFVSIHADSMPNFPQWSGVTVFKASPRLFAKAQKLAKEVARNVKMCSDTMCWSISPLLLNLATTVTFAESSRLAEKIVKSLKAHVNDEIAVNIRDMQRNIVVLKTPGRPAVLVESGFLTNPVDRKRLITQWYQEEIAKGIAKGIVGYLESLNNVAVAEG